MEKKESIIIITVLLFVISFMANANAAVICQYATSASATSQNTGGSLASYATGAPNAPYTGQCTKWSGYSYSWSPSNWNVVANLTLNYATKVNVTNFTIIGDYDICWRKMWLKNSQTGQTKMVFNGFDLACVSTKNQSGNFSADTIILETCGWGWSSTDAVQMCGNNNSISNSSVCGNSIIQTGEDCDKGSLNGVTCNPLYNKSCTYCSNVCKNVTVKGNYCGDSLLNSTYEECDKGSLNGVACNPLYNKSCTYCSNVCKNVTVKGNYCGDSLLNSTYEECDKGSLNGVTCNPLYNKSCTYCSNVCKNVTVKGNYCGDGILNSTYEECDDRNLIDDDSCSSLCKKENVSLYLVPYLGDIDGSIDSDWYYFYKNLTKWHNQTGIKGSFSFYPDTMNNLEFNRIIADMYNTPSLELITKGESEYNDTPLDLMNYSQTKLVLKELQDKFIREMQILGYTNVSAPVTYNQKSAKFTNITRDAVHDLGFKIYLDQYVSEYGYIEPLPDFDITQYSVSLTVSGLPGPDETYKKPEQVIAELINFNNSEMIYINGTKVIPLLCHQQDFRINENSSVINQTKWNIYTTLLINARKDPRIKLLNPEEVFDLRHPGYVPNISLCGNEELETLEECDDGNVINGDGCSSICKIENATFSYSFPKITIIEPLQDKIIDLSKNSATVKIFTVNATECRFSYDRNFDFNEGTILSTTDQKTYYFTFNKPVSMDQIAIYYKCKNSAGNINPYGTMHRFSFKKLNDSFIEVCNWYNCLEGAASISIDDGYYPSFGATHATCREALEANNITGTYFLSFTDSYTSTDWNLWRSVYSSGHEIGGHSQTHNCSYFQSEDYFDSETEANINDMMDNIGIQEVNLTTFAWPCGVTNPKYQDWIKDYYEFARGYHINSIESKNPENTLNYNSINSINVGLQPTDYFLLADVTENYQDWVNYVYHESCHNQSLMSYLPTKNLWIEPIGTVSKYITERNNVRMQNISSTDNKTTFNLINPLNTTIYNEKLTLKIYLGNNSISSIKVNNISISFTGFKVASQNYVKFDVSSVPINSIEIFWINVSVPYCGDKKINQGSEECDDGNTVNGDSCSSLCKIGDNNKLYVILYVGNIDGGANPEWYKFYDQLTEYYEETEIPVAFSFFPASIDTSDKAFSLAFKKMYSVDNIKLMQKGFTMNATEEHMEDLSFNEQKKIIKNGRYYYIESMKKILNSTSIRIPVTYVAPFGKFTKDTRKALQELGFRTNFGVYYVGDIGPVQGTEFLDMIQYGVSFTTSGAAGRETVFKSPDEIINEVLYYDRTDVPILKANGKRVVPLYAHQPDFEDASIDTQIDEEKWAIYNETITRLLQNPDVKFVTPNQIWNLNHPFCIPTGVSEEFCNQVDDDCDGSIDENFVVTTSSCGIGACKRSGELKCMGYETDTCKPGNPTAEVCNDNIDNDCDGQTDENCGLSSFCQYAIQANATSQNLAGSFASYATGAPNAPFTGQCSQWSGYGYSWSPTNWNVMANLTLSYESKVNVTNFTISGDYNMCWSKMWLKNSQTGQIKEVFSGFDINCVSTQNQTGNFMADTIILQTCGWSWSSTDAVEMCGITA